MSRGETNPFTAGCAADRANQEVFIPVIGRRTGTEFKMREFTYGVLDSDPHSPLSCVSVANSSLSVDLWKGCAWQCSYCHVQGGLQDLDPETLTMPKRPEPRSRFEVEDVVDALVEHPFFERNKSVISIGTASTEPFARGPVSDSTFEIMEQFVARGYKNPFWVVTKAGFPKGYEERLKSVTENGNQVMISICWANNPKHVEPVQTNRFRNVQAAHEAGATISWYLRPLADSWSIDPTKLAETFETASKYAPWVDEIIPGGLRWTMGIEYGVNEVRGQEMPNIPHKDNVKDLSEETWVLIHELAEKYFPGVPLYHKSSCGLSLMLEAPNHNLVQRHNRDACEASTCPAAQRDRCESYQVPGRSELQHRLATIGLKEIEVVSVDQGTGKVTTKPELGTLTFALKHLVEIQTARE